jgi:hypothetical protein
VFLTDSDDVVFSVDPGLYPDPGPDGRHDPDPAP